LQLLGDLSKPGPSPVLRERLRNLASQRFADELELSPRLITPNETPLRWLSPILFAASLILIGVAALFLAHSRPGRTLHPDGTSAISSVASPAGGVSTATLARSSGTRPEVAYHPPRRLAVQSGPQRMTLRLPYSNSAIENGTQATIRVSMSQSDLLSLGFPVNATLQDRRILADLTLGDDGLPRAISLPLPFEVIKEKK
jgi:hypothetical protein